MSSAFALVRARARASYPKRPCENEACNYSKHTEVSHIKAISDFDLETKVSVINHPSNLIRLCLNCHWEFDRGHILIENLRH